MSCGFPFPDMVCSRYTKHAHLINNCYPVKEGENGPKPSELSYLTFYANSRPAKLTKVGSFLEKKVERDIAKGRKQLSTVRSKTNRNDNRNDTNYFFRLPEIIRFLWISSKLWFKLVIETWTCFRHMLWTYSRWFLEQGISNWLILHAER